MPKKRKLPAKPKENAHYAYITPSVLTWAIERNGKSRDEIAHALKMKVEDLARWESGVPPQYKKAEKLAKELRVPFGMLFLSEPPDISIKLPDMRRLQGNYRQTPNFIELVHDAMLRQDWYRDLAKSQEDQPLPFVGRYTIKDSIEAVAADIRKALGIGAPMRKNAKRQVQYLMALSEAVEATGVLVMRSGFVKNNNRRRVEVAEFQGFALADPLAPVVFVNANDFETAQVFTLIHELVHIWIGQTGISKPNDGIATTNEIERFCNAVTAEVLVPKAEFPVIWLSERKNLNALARRYWVSRLVILNRAFELGLITKAEQRAMRKSVAHLYLHDPDKKKKDRPGGNFFATAAIRAGHRLTDTVVTQVAHGGLVVRDAARLLGMSQFAIANIAFPRARAS